MRLSKSEGKGLSDFGFAWTVMLILGIIMNSGSTLVGQPSVADKSECRGLLSRCLQAQSATDHISMQVVVDEEWVKTLDRNTARKKRHEFLIRRDRDLLDLSGRRLFFDKYKKLSSQIRIVVNKQYYIHHDTRFLMPRTPSGYAVSQQKRIDYLKNLLSVGDLGLFLDGYLLGFGEKRIAEWVLESNNFVLRGEERVDTVPCKVIESHTQQGKITLWLDEARGCLPLRAFCERRDGDFLGDKPISQQPKITFGQDQPPASQTAWSAQVSIQRIVQIGDDFVPVEGQMIVTEKYDNGKETVNIKKVQRTGIKLHSSFEGTDAFVTDLKDGTRVSNWDDPNSGVVYEWRDGKVVPAFSDFAGTAESKWSGRSVLFVLFWFVAGVVLLSVSLRYIWRYKKTGG